MHPRPLRGGLLLLLLALLLPALRPPGAQAAPAALTRVLATPDYTGDFPDPSVLRVGGLAYAYATNSGAAYVPVLVSTDLVHWHAAGDALPRPARWGVARNAAAHPLEVWAPGVTRVGGRYLMFYALRARVSPRRTCLSVAVADDPLGPFRDGSSAPLHCDADPAGSIDPQPFTDADGRRYLVWKSEGEAGRTPTRLWSQPLDAAGTAFARGTSPHLLLQTALAWEQPIVENPSLVRYGGRYVLLYSAGHWQSPAYSTGYALCTTATGPCRRGGTAPLLARHGRVLGPGGGSAFLDGAGQLRLAHHYWAGAPTSYPGGLRRLGVAWLGWDRTGHLRVLSDR